MSAVRKLESDASVLNVVGSGRQLLGVEEAARIIGLSVWTLRSWAYSGRIASHKVSTRLMFNREDLDRIIESSRRPAVPGPGAKSVSRV